MIPSNVALNTATWNVTLSVRHQPAAWNADLALLEVALPMLAPEELQPFHATLESQGSAVIFQEVTVVDAGARIYAAVGPTNRTTFPIVLRFGENPPAQTPIDGSTESLSELLIRSS
jgi:hypothetical protein